MTVLDTLLASHQCPLPSSADADSPASETVRAAVLVDTACVAVMDAAAADAVWEDFLMDGHDHDHAAGHLMVNQGSVGTHLPFDTTCPVVVSTALDGSTVRVDVELVPWDEDVDSGRRPDGWTAADETEFASDLYDTRATGWSAPATVLVGAGPLIVADPADIEVPSGNRLEVPLPGSVPGGTLHVSVLSGYGYRRLLRVVWVAPGVEPVYASTVDAAGDEDGTSDVEAAVAAGESVPGAGDGSQVRERAVAELAVVEQDIANLDAEGFTVADLEDADLGTVEQDAIAALSADDSGSWFVDGA